MVPAVANMAAPASLTDFEFGRRRRLPLDLQASFPLQGETIHGSNSPQASHGSQLRLGPASSCLYRQNGGRCKRGRGPEPGQPMRTQQRVPRPMRRQPPPVAGAGRGAVRSGCCRGLKSCGRSMSGVTARLPEPRRRAFPALAEGSCSSVGLPGRAASTLLP